MRFYFLKPIFIFSFILYTIKWNGYFFPRRNMQFCNGVCHLSSSAARMTWQIFDNIWYLFTLFPLFYLYLCCWCTVTICRLCKMMSSWWRLGCFGGSDLYACSWGCVICFLIIADWAVIYMFIWFSKWVDKFLFYILNLIM